jgi:sugar/nucleoside kinase (ribokinase family)
MQRQLDFACAAAAMNCMSEGARGGIGTVEAIEALMRGGDRYGHPVYLPEELAVAD